MMAITESIMITRMMSIVLGNHDEMKKKIVVVVGGRRNRSERLSILI